MRNTLGLAALGAVAAITLVSVLDAQDAPASPQAPNAARVSVVGDFNGWDGRSHLLSVHGASGVWELFVPGVATGALVRAVEDIRDGRADM